MFLKNVIFLYDTWPIRWKFSQHCRYWWLGTSAPGISNGVRIHAFPIDQSHRCGHRQVACREPAGSYDKTTRTATCFEHKTQYLLIRAPYTLIVVFWHISKIPPMIGQSQISCNIPTFFINYICEILLYNWQLVVVTHELIYGVRVLSARGKILWNRSIVY